MGVHYIAVECVNCLCSILIYYVVSNIYSHSQFIKSSRMCNICSAFSLLKTWDGKLSIYQATINVRTETYTYKIHYYVKCGVHLLVNFTRFLKNQTIHVLKVIKINCCYNIKIYMRKVRGSEHIFLPRSKIFSPS